MFILKGKKDNDNKVETEVKEETVKEEKEMKKDGKKMVKRIVIGALSVAAVIGGVALAIVTNKEDASTGFEEKPSDQETDIEDDFTEV